MSASLAVVPSAREILQPDISWIKKNVPVLEVGKALGMRILQRRAKCWRPENHRHGDADPSLRFYERGNRVRCFVCDMRGGHSNVDLVMGLLGVTVGEAVRWIAERFTVPNVKPGRPLGRRASEPAPYRVGVHGSDFEVLVKSGMWGQLSPGERSILLVLWEFRDPESGLTQMSYAATMRYTGLGSRSTVFRGLATLSKRHAIQISHGARVGVVRQCNVYRVTLDDPKFLDACNAVAQVTRAEVAQERAYRKELRTARERLARLVTARPKPILNTNTGGGLRPPDPPFSLSLQRKESPTATCEGQDLSPRGVLTSNKPVHGVDREIGVLRELAKSKTLPHKTKAEEEAGWLKLQAQRRQILADPKYATEQVSRE